MSLCGIQVAGLRQVTDLRQVTGLRAWMSPSFALLIFLVLPAMVRVRPDTMLTDPGTGWHLKTGDYIPDTGTIPTHDLFSLTRPDFLRTP